MSALGQKQTLQHVRAIRFTPKSGHRRSGACITFDAAAPAAWRYSPQSAAPRRTRCADGVRCRPVIHRVFTGKTGDLVFARRTGLALAMAARFIVPLALVSMIGPSLATGSPACMTESEARAKFPRAHLIWVGTNHCWTFGAVSVHSRRPVLAAEPVPSPRPAIAAVPVPSARPEIAAAPSSRPEIDSGGIDITGAQCQYSPCE